MITRLAAFLFWVVVLFTMAATGVSSVLADPGQPATAKHGSSKTERCSQ